MLGVGNNTRAREGEPAPKRSVFFPWLIHLTHHLAFTPSLDLPFGSGHQPPMPLTATAPLIASLLKSQCPLIETQNVKQNTLVRVAHALIILLKIKRTRIYLNTLAARFLET